MKKRSALTRTGIHTIDDGQLTAATGGNDPQVVCPCTNKVPGPAATVGHAIDDAIVPIVYKISEALTDAYDYVTGD